ncbi:MAG: ATP-binding protein [bacterium]
MRVAVASGKGGTGKTTVAAALVHAIGSGSGRGGTEGTPLMLDCDVEAPDAHIYLQPVLDESRAVSIPIPSVDEVRCDLCGRCAEVCRFGALAVLASGIKTFPALCHGCGSCARVCPRGAITEVRRKIGVIETGAAPPGVRFARGMLDVGEPMAVPVIRELLREIDGIGADAPVVLDAPPGTSCPAMAVLRGADYALLVAEPTPFGLHDLRLMTEAVREMGLPAGVVLNREGIGDGEVERFCRQTGLKVLLRIPYQREIAEGLARGILLTAVVPGLEAAFLGLWQRIQQEQMADVH